MALLRPLDLLLLSLICAVPACGVGSGSSSKNQSLPESPFTAWTSRSDVQGPFPAELTASWFKGGKTQLSYFEVDGAAIAEGDMLLKPTDTPEGGQPSAKGFGTQARANLWPEGVVPYEITSGMSNEAEILQAIEHWRSKTGIRFVPRTNQQDYVVFKTGNLNCYSYLGRVGGAQDISLSPACNMAAIAHEMGHAVGLMHEQMRPDRDQYITILWDNIDPAYQSQFTVESGYAVKLGTYDVTSVMHYPSSAFSKNGQPALVTKDGKTIPYMTGLSRGDVESVASLYEGILPSEPSTNDPSTNEPSTGAGSETLVLAAKLVADHTPDGSSCTYTVSGAGEADARGRFTVTLQVAGTGVAQELRFKLNKTFKAADNAAILASLMTRGPLAQCLQ